MGIGSRYPQPLCLRNADTRTVHPGIGELRRASPFIYTNADYCGVAVTGTGAFFGVLR